MAVLIEALSVVIRCQAIVRKYSGGAKAFMDSIPNKTLCSDGEVASVSFMTPNEVGSFVEYLSSKGLAYKVESKSVDIVVVDQLSGKTTDCDWVGFGKTDWNGNSSQPISVCFAKPSRIDHVVVPDGWSYELSISSNYKYVSGENIPSNLKFLRKEKNLDVLFDKESGKEYYVRRS